MKDTNYLVVSILKKLDTEKPHEAGDMIVKSLVEQDADSRAWPTDDEVRSELPKVKSRPYGNVKQSRLRDA